MSPAPPSNPVPEGTKKLGQLLIERGRVSGGQVMRAILSQRAAGGRLGTCLLELGPEEAFGETRRGSRRGTGPGDDPVRTK